MPDSPNDEKWKSFEKMTQEQKAELIDELTEEERQEYYAWVAAQRGD